VLYAPWLATCSGLCPLVAGSFNPRLGRGGLYIGAKPRTLAPLTRGAPRVLESALPQGAGLSVTFRSVVPAVPADPAMRRFAALAIQAGERRRRADAEKNMSDTPRAAHGGAPNLSICR
jgi:hypothetical protein